MSLKEKLLDFSGALTTATNHAPENYPAWSSWTYETNMADLKELWAEIRPKLKKDIDQVKFIDGKLQEAFAAYDAKDKEKGQDAILAIYNLDVKTLR
ncbi:hypothetical protein [Duganella sp. HH101]|uniref:hypothetical protein n=1 Tax=Duganella sp. HH101 TaxID=1781066 RepID=UPI000893EAB5|nr:hypothetical protein [Duganella sp. HH101]OFA06689.1 hypothetical protein DUGA2_00170 [Duganella sp. HH101]